jgi:hypothetical protein
MARPNKDFLLAWGSLDRLDVKSGWRSIAIESAGPIGIHAGRRFPGNEEAMFAHFHHAKMASNEKLPDGQGFFIERIDSLGDGSARLALTRKPDGSLDLFLAMVCDVAGALDAAAIEDADQHRLLRVFLGRVRAWQEFMRKGAQALSAEAEIGLFGELSVLALMIESGAPASVALESWVGPLDGVQDFEIGTGAIEVKTTLSDAGFIAKIGSLEQLDDSIRKPLFVVGARLKQIAAGINLPELVDSIRATVAGETDALRLLSERLIAAGYFANQRDHYTRRFETADVKAIEVGANFPRLTHGTVPLGLTRAIYDVDLEKVPGAVSDIETALRKLGAI